MRYRTGRQGGDDNAGTTNFLGNNETDSFLRGTNCPDVDVAIFLENDRRRNKAVQDEIAVTAPQKAVERRPRPSKVVPIEAMAMARSLRKTPARPGNKMRTRLEDSLKRIIRLKFGAERQRPQECRM